MRPIPGSIPGERTGAICAQEKRFMDHLTDSNNEFIFDPDCADCLEDSADDNEIDWVIEQLQRNN